ncbi:tripartite motif-containing protein 47-like [Seriola lalandi dorsalis]|uniref:tripartite motif-containing protein 47-like n=1 Tax=Seriola lalandi dorsalis TaxID=1841481 RepID=UPI000C6F633F|nr:tripartite motif-containing protein 47-like [Seriola lalandi dorsalis]
MAYNQELFDCSICLQLLEDPVTTACGHSYCITCINSFWDRNNNSGETYSCPQCRETFYPRPVLKRNTLLSNLLEENRKTTGPSAAIAAAAADDGDSCFTPGDVQCDACTGRKRKAFKFCRVCLASYCETHLQPHFEVPPLKRHSLIPASARIKESICGRHNKLLEIYCRTDQQFTCMMCVMDEHKDHDTVAVAAEKCAMERQLERTRQEITDRVLSAKLKMAELRHAADSIRDAAWEACDDFERLCVEHIRLYVRSVERKRSEMREKVGGAEKAGVDWTNSCLGQLQREVSELRRREDKLNQLSLTEDPIQFLQGFKALGNLTASPHSHERLDTLTEFVTAQKDTLKNMCNKEKNRLLYSEEHLLLKIPRLQEEIKSRTEVLTKYKNSEVEVDPDTVAAFLSLSKCNREISWSDRDQAHPDHHERFTYYHQALCKKGLQGNHYWEVEWDGGIVEVAVSYKGIKRKGSGQDCCFGHNHLSWKLTCSPSGCTFWHDNLHKGQIPPARSRRVGVHLDYEAGMLDFFSVHNSDRLMLLHRSQTTFTEPLYPGFSVDLGATLKICNI